MRILTDMAKATLADGYLLEGETPEQGLRRAANAYASNSDHADRLFKYASQGWMMFATPVLANAGTERGLPISCFLNYTPDSLVGILDLYSESAMMSAGGGGIGTYVGAMRSDGASTRRGNKSTGSIPFIKGMDSICSAFKQGKIRRGSWAVYSDISHPEIEEFIDSRKFSGVSRDPNRTFYNLHHAVNIPDAFMEAVSVGGMWNLIDPHSKKIVKSLPARELWEKLLITRMETGEPYFHFIDTSNKHLPQSLKDKNLYINNSNLCSEILLPTNEERSAVCCLSSLNLEYFDEWEHTRIVEDMVEMLDNVLETFINKASALGTDNRYAHLHKAVHSARHERSLGLGAMGFHSWLQKNEIPFESAMAVSWNKKIFSLIQERAKEQSYALARTRGAYLDDCGSGLRNSHLLAIAPNASSSIVCGGASPGIEPYVGNTYQHKTMRGTFTVRNKYLPKHIDMTEDLWQKVNMSGGSVADLPIDPHLKDVFATAYELDQRWIVQHASDRQPFICQGQSVNLFFPPEHPDLAKYLHDVHMQAWKGGLKTLYYLRSNAPKQADSVGTKIKKYESTECLACEG